MPSPNKFGDSETNTPVIVRHSNNNPLQDHRWLSGKSNTNRGTTEEMRLLSVTSDRSGPWGPADSIDTNDGSETPNSANPNNLFPQMPFNGISILHGHSAPGNSGTESPRTQKNVRMSSKYGRMRKRIVFKNGEVNIHLNNISKRNRRYLQDIFITLVDIQWRWTFVIFTASFLMSWTLFAMVWWLIAFTHGDLEPDHLPAEQETSGWTPCVASFNGFASAFLFSIETQHTIGYGSRYTTEECPAAIFVMCMQSILGVMIQAFMVGVVFSKMSRPKKRTQTLMYSRNGVICQRDGVLSLMFRVGDMRKSHIICTNVRALLVKRKNTPEGEVLQYYQHELTVGVDSDQQSVFFIWPMVVVHRMDKESPLYNMSAADLIREKFEIVIILEGVIESTGATTQARTSYLPSELLWGHRFEPMVSFKKEFGGYSVDYSLFNSTYEIDTPLCSAKDLDELRNIQNEMKNRFSLMSTTNRNSRIPELKAK